MRRFYLFKDGVQKGSMETREEALEMICLWQSRETHPFPRPLLPRGALVYKSAHRPDSARLTNRKSLI